MGQALSHMADALSGGEAAQAERFRSQGAGSFARCVVGVRDGVPFRADAPRERFSAADRALIAQVHSYMPRVRLLSVLNARLLADRGADEPCYTAAELEEEIRRVAPKAATQRAGDWAGLRKLLSDARREGVLDMVTEQVIQDFALIFRCTPKQVITLKDILLAHDNSQEGV